MYGLRKSYVDREMRIARVTSMFAMNTGILKFFEFLCILHK